MFNPFNYLLFRCSQGLITKQQLCSTVQYWVYTRRLILFFLHIFVVFMKTLLRLFTYFNYWLAVIMNVVINPKWTMWLSLGEQACESFQHHRGTLKGKLYTSFLQRLHSNVSWSSPATVHSDFSRPVLLPLEHHLSRILRHCYLQLPSVYRIPPPHAPMQGWM